MIMSRSMCRTDQASTQPTPVEIWFDHEKLDVYQEAIEFIAWSADLIERTSRLGEIKDQLERASSSITLNISEGNGKYSMNDRCRFFDMAKASTLECAAILDVLVARRRLTVADTRPGKERLKRVVRMLMGLIKRNTERTYARNDAQQ
jgi:four helix bundle protein